MGFRVGLEFAVVGLATAAVTLSRVIFGIGVDLGFGEVDFVFAGIMDYWSLFGRLKTVKFLKEFWHCIFTFLLKLS